MKIAFHEGKIYIKGLTNAQFNVIAGWGLMEWNKKERVLHAPAGRELLNHLAEFFPLPDQIEKERCRLNDIASAVDEERVKQNPEPLYDYPVKFSLYQHQIRAANMCLLTFGLIPVPQREENICSR